MDPCKDTKQRNQVDDDDDDDDEFSQRIDTMYVILPTCWIKYFLLFLPTKKEKAPKKKAWKGFSMNTIPVGTRIIFVSCFMLFNG